MTVPAVVVFVLACLTGAGASKLRAAAKDYEWSLADLAAGESSLAPPEILLMSSPMERKVSYVELIDHKAHGGVRPLIDTGLDQPKGLAYDPSEGVLYVADPGQRKIFRYSLAVRAAAAGGEVNYEVVVNDLQLPVVEDVNSQWLAVDSIGNLFFSDKDRRSIDTLSLRVIKQIVSGKVDVSTLPRTTQQEVADAGAGHRSTPAAVVSLYKASEAGSFGKSYVGAPAGVAVDGPHIVWTNAEGGAEDGTVVSGFATLAAASSDPLDSMAGMPHSLPLTRSLESALGVVAVDSMLIMSGPSTVVYGLCRGGSGVQTLADSFVSPRGLAYDGESTAYVADAGASAVYAMPAGRCHAGLPVLPVVSFHNVFGLAVLQGKALESVHTRYQEGLGVMNTLTNFVRWTLR